MNLSHNGNMSTTNIVWKNLEKSILASVASVATIEANLVDYYNTEFKLLQELSSKSNTILEGLHDIISKSNNS